MLRTVLGYGAVLMSAGIVKGVAASLGAGRLLASQLFEVKPYDPVTYALVGRYWRRRRWRRA